MHILLSSKIAEVNGTPAKRSKGAYFIRDSLLSRIYGPDTQAAIARRVDMSTPRVSSESYQGSDEIWPGVEILFSGWEMTVMDEVFLSRFPDLKMIFYGAGSIKRCVTEEFWKSGIRITTAAAANAIPVAEYTCAQIIAGLKGTYQASLYIRREGKIPPATFPPGCFQTTVGLLSLGMIGRMVAQRLHQHDVNIIAYDPLVTQEEADRLKVTLLPLDEIFARADVVSCHTPLLPETYHMIRGYHFESLKPNASFINTARGAVVAENEMIEVLTRRPDLMAILDVTWPDPPLPGSPLFTLDNVILTPHIAGSIGNECRRMGQHMVAELERYLAGKPLLYELSEERALVTA